MHIYVTGLLSHNHDDTVAYGTIDNGKTITNNERLTEKVPIVFTTNYCWAVSIFYLFLIQNGIPRYFGQAQLTSYSWHFC